MQNMQVSRRGFIGATGVAAISGLGLGAVTAFAEDAPDPVAELRANPEAAAEAFAQVEDFPINLVPATDEHPGMEGVEQVLLDRATIHGGVPQNTRDINRDITDEQMTLILKAAMTAPTIVDMRTTHFIVIRDQETMEKINGWQLGGNCPVCVAIVSDGGPATIDAGMAAMAMMVQASAMGICTCVQGQGFDALDSDGNPKDYSWLGLTEGWYPEVYVSFGYPAVDAYASASVDIFDENRIHYEKL